VKLLAVDASKSYIFPYHQTQQSRSFLGLGEKAPIGLLLAAVGFLKFGFCALLLFGLLFESLATTSGDVRRVFVGYFFVLLLQNQSIHHRGKMDYPSTADSR